MASGKNSCQHHILQQPAKIFRISEGSDYFGVQNFQCKKKKTVTLVKLDTLPFLRIYQFSPGVLTSVVGPVSLPVSCKSLSLRYSLAKSKMAANLDRIQQQMQTELEKFKSVQKGNSYKNVRRETSNLFVLYGCQGFVFSDKNCPRENGCDCCIKKNRGA